MWTSIGTNVLTMLDASSTTELVVYEQGTALSI